MCVFCGERERHVVSLPRLALDVSCFRFSAEEKTKVVEGVVARRGGESWSLDGVESFEISLFFSGQRFKMWREGSD